MLPTGNYPGSNRRCGQSDLSLSPLYNRFDLPIHKTLQNRLATRRTSLYRAHRMWNSSCCFCCSIYPLYRARFRATLYLTIRAYTGRCFLFWNTRKTLHRLSNRAHGLFFLFRNRIGRAKALALYYHFLCAPRLKDFRIFARLNRLLSQNSPHVYYTQFSACCQA